MYIQWEKSYIGHDLNCEKVSVSLCDKWLEIHTHILFYFNLLIFFIFILKILVSHLLIDWIVKHVSK